MEAVLKKKGGNGARAPLASHDLQKSKSSEQQQD
jgi:hypothetical protein